MSRAKEQFYDRHVQITQPFVREWKRPRQWHRELSDRQETEFLDTYDDIRTAMKNVTLQLRQKSVDSSFSNDSLLSITSNPSLIALDLDDSCPFCTACGEDGVESFRQNGQSCNELLAREHRISRLYRSSCTKDHGQVLR
jgi:hypothetical protein